MRETKCDQELVEELVDLANKSEGNINAVCGKTMCCHDFYEGQGRVDGAFCEYSLEDKMAYLETCKKNGITNIEMESLCFTGLLNHAKIRGSLKNY